MENMPEKLPKKANVKYIVYLSFLIALLAIMSFTPLGYLKTAGIEISFLCIPVILAAVLLGPLASTILGFAFGLSSFITAFVSPTLFSTTLLGINPFSTFLLCMIPRILMGLFTGLIFRFFSSFKKLRPVSHTIASSAAALLNSIFFTIFLWFLFSGSPVFSETFPFGANFGTLITTMIGFNALLELIVCGLVGVLVGRVAFAVERRSVKKTQAMEVLLEGQESSAPFENSVSEAAENSSADGLE